MEYYWTSPIKLTFKWQVEKRSLNGDSLQIEEFDNKSLADDFLSTTNYYINGVLTHSSIN